MGPRNEDAQVEKLNSANAALMAEFARCCIKLGYIAQAHTTLDRILGIQYRDAKTFFFIQPHAVLNTPSPFTHLPETQSATALYYKGLIFLAQNDNNRALYCFLRALILHPGNEAVDHELDQLGERLDRSPQSGDTVALHNIEYVLGPYWHKPVNYPGPPTPQRSSSGGV